MGHKLLICRGLLPMQNIYKKKKSLFFNLTLDKPRFSSVHLHSQTTGNTAN